MRPSEDPGMAADLARCMAENEDWSRQWNRTGNMGGQPILDKVTVRTAVQLLASDLLRDALTQQEVPRFPVEPPPGSVMRWVKELPTGRKETRSYTYVALRVGEGWYLTGRETGCISFEELVDQIGDCECSIATTWDDIPRVEPSPFEDLTPAEWHRQMFPQMYGPNVEGATEPAGRPPVVDEDDLAGN